MLITKKDASQFGVHHRPAIAPLGVVILMGRSIAPWLSSLWARTFVRVTVKPVHFATTRLALRTQEVLGDFPGGLKDIRTTRQEVRDALFEVFARWIEVRVTWMDFVLIPSSTSSHLLGRLQSENSRVRREQGKEKFLYVWRSF